MLSGDIRMTGDVSPVKTVLQCFHPILTWCRMRTMAKGREKESQERHC